MDGLKAERSNLVMARSEDLEIVVRAAADGLASDLNRMAGMMRSFAKETARSSPKLDSVIDTSSLKNNAKDLKNIQSEIKATRSSFSELAVGAAVFSAEFVAIQAGVQGFSDVVSGAFTQIRDSVLKASDFEQTKLAFEVMLDSGQAATKMLGELRDLSKIAPFRNSEITDAARQLMAYNIAADQVIPHLRMLAEVTAGLGGKTNLGEMAYIYGTLNTQGVALSRDIYQFTNRGVELIPNLAKQFGVTTDEVRKLVEEGRVGFPEVGKALESLTLPGGKFNGMLERQGQAMKGVWTTTLDAIDLAKMKLGNILIQELGLKDVAKDIERFALNVEGGMDRIRPFIKLAGEAAKAVAHIGYELGKATFNSADIGITSLVSALPGLKSVGAELSAVLNDIKDFKIDEKAIGLAALDVAELIGVGFAHVADSIKGYGADIKKYVLDPIIDAAKLLKRYWNRGEGGSTGHSRGDPCRNRLVQGQSGPD